MKNLRIPLLAAALFLAGWFYVGAQVIPQGGNAGAVGGSVTQYAVGSDASGTPTTMLVGFKGAGDLTELASAGTPFPVTMINTLDAVNDSITIYGSDDGGTTKRILKTDSGGALQVDLEAGHGLLTTTAHDAAFGTAGSADSQVRTVQGVSGMTPVMISGANANSKINCTNNAFLNMTTATTTEIVALSGSTIIYVCSFSIVSNGGTATTVKFVDGTGTNCGTSQSDRSAGMPLTAATNTVGVARGSGEGMILKTSTAGDALCVTSSGAATIGVDISYAQF